MFFWFFNFNNNIIELKIIDKGFIWFVDSVVGAVVCPAKPALLQAV